MKIVIIFNHPWEGSYCNSVLQSVIAGAERAGNVIDTIHLDKEGFNLVMTADDLRGFVNSQQLIPKYWNTVSASVKQIILFLFSCLVGADAGHDKRVYR